MAQIARAEPNLRGLYECAYCHAEYRDPAPAAWCCDPEYERER